MIILFALITVVWLFAGLHLAYGYESLLITFMVLDAILVRTLSSSNCASSSSLLNKDEDNKPTTFRAMCNLVTKGIRNSFQLVSLFCRL